jgi:hypothetical protein
MPAGKPLPDGYSARFTFDDFPAIELFMKQPTPIGFEGGGANPQSTMENVKFRTQRPKKLITVTGSSITCAYDPKFLDTLITTNGGMLLHNQLCHVEYGDGSKHNFWGWLESFKPGALQEGQQPEATVMVEVSNLNVSGVETGPTYTAPP